MEEQQKPHSMFWGILSCLVGHFTFCPCQFLTRMVLFRLRQLSEFDIISLSCELWSWLHIWHEMGQLTVLYDVSMFICTCSLSWIWKNERKSLSYTRVLRSTLISWDSLELVPWITGYLLPGPLDFSFGIFPLLLILQLNQGLAPHMWHARRLFRLGALPGSHDCDQCNATNTPLEHGRWQLQIKQTWVDLTSW